MITVDRLRNSYLVPADHPDPEQVRVSLDEVARRCIPEAFGRALERVLRPGHPSVWFIRRLELALTLDARPGDIDQVGESWGEHLAAVVVRALAAGPDGDNIVRFEAREHFLAAFVLDAARGRARDRWYYGEMEGLRALPPGAQIREVLAREPSRARDVLALIEAAGSLRTVLEALSDFDALAVLELCAGNACDLASVLTAARFWNRAAAWNLGARRRALAAAVSSGFACPTEILLHLAAFARAVHAGYMSGKREWRDRLAPEDAAGIISAVAAIEQLAEGDPGGLSDLLRTLADAPADTTTARIPEIVTAFAAVWLLLPAILEAADREVLEDPVLRWLFVVRLLGRGATALAPGDPGLLLFAGLEDAPSDEQIGAARLPCNGTTAEDLSWFDCNPLLDPATDAALSALAARVMRNFAARLVAFHDSSFAFLHENLLAGAGVIRISDRRLEVHLPVVPLGVVLRLAGVHGRECAPLWLGCRTVRLLLTG